MSQSLYKPVYNSDWAILIGVNEYLDTRIVDLHGPVADATDLRDALVSRYNFPQDQVFLLTDRQATKEHILSALEHITGDCVDPDDRILIFFSGHGIVRRGRGKTYYLVPSDAQVDDWNSFISQESFLTKCRHIPAKHVLFVIDACHSGSFVREPKQVAPDLQEMLNHSAWQAIGASLPDQVALDAGSRQHSLFTEYFLRGLRGEAAGSDGVLTFSHLAVFVRDNVAQVHAKQVPIFGYLPDSDSGEFVFHFEVKEEVPQEIERALLSELSRVQIAAVWELETLAISKDADKSYRSRTKLQDIAANAEDEWVRLAAQVTIRLSIPVLEALKKNWVKGPLFDPSDSSVFDRIVSAVEYDGYNNYYLNNDAIKLLSSFGLSRWDDVSPGEKRRFARAVIRSAMFGAFGSQRFLKAAERIPDAWLEGIVNEMAIYWMTHRSNLSSALEIEAAYNPLCVWVDRTRNLPDSWILLLEATLQRVVPGWYRGYQGARAYLRQIWQKINDVLDKTLLEEPDLLVRFMDLL